MHMGRGLMWFSPLFAKGFVLFWPIYISLYCNYIITVTADCSASFQPENYFTVAIFENIYNILDRFLINELK